MDGTNLNKPSEFQNASYDCWSLRDIIRDVGLTMEERSDAVSEMDELAQSGDVHCTSVSKEKGHRTIDNFLITLQ